MTTNMKNVAPICRWLARKPATSRSRGIANREALMLIAMRPASTTNQVSGAMNVSVAQALNQSGRCRWSSSRPNRSSS